MNDKQVVMLVCIAMVGMWMLSSPRCNRGCKTVAEHLVRHAVDDLIAGLLAG